MTFYILSTIQYRYRLLAASKMGSQLAQDIFAKNKGIYHPICRKMVGADLAKAAASSGSSGSGSTGANGSIIKNTNAFIRCVAIAGSMFLLGQLK